MKMNNVSSIDLMLLGLIRNQPMSAYDLSKLEGVYEMVKISVPAIYKNIIRLQEKGFLSLTCMKEGKMPEKKIYAITKKGEDHFNKLLINCAKNPIKFYFDFNVSLLFTASIDYETGIKLIQLVRDNTQQKINHLNQQLDLFKDLPFPLPNIAEQQLRLSQELFNWLNAFEDTFKKGQHH